MRHARLPQLRSLLSAAAIAVIAACADSEDTGGAIVEDGGAPEAPPDVDGGADAADAEEGDAAVRTCSDQGFCHVVVPPNETLRDVWGDGTTVWAVSEQGHVLRWDGQKWGVHTKKLGALYAIWGSGPTDIWIGGARGLYHGSGASSQAIVFEPVDAPGDPEIPILSIWGTGPDDVLAVGGNVSFFDGMPHARVLRLRRGGDAGPGWELDPISAEPFVFKRVWGSTAAGAWIAGDDGSDFPQTSGAFVRAPGTDELLPVTIDADLPDESVEQGIATAISGGGMTADGRVLVIGKTPSTPAFWYGAVGDDGTVTWTFERRKESDLPLWAVWSVAGEATWVAGDYGTLRSRDVSGAKWMPAAMMVSDFPVIEPLYGIWGTAPDDFWVVGHDTAIHRMPREEP